MRPFRLTDLVQASLILMGFLAAAAWNVLMMADQLAEPPGEAFVALLGPICAAAFVFWFGTLLVQRDRAILSTAIFEQCCFGSGIVLIGLSLASFAGLDSPAAPVFWQGCFIASCFLFMARSWLEKRMLATRPGVIFLGFAEEAARLLREFPQMNVLGSIVPEDAVLPEMVKSLGPATELANIVQENPPGHLVVLDWTGVSRRAVLACRRSNIVVSEFSQFYERVAGRVCSPRCEASAFLQAGESIKRNAALQAVYSNLVGVTLVILAMPLMFLTALAIRLSLGPGPILGRVECAGFLQIPFQLLNFRTSRRGSRETSGVGRFLVSSGLVRLPQLFNVIRGELAICGPRPVPRENAAYLRRLIPFYSERFSVKPGFFGWAQIQMLPAQIGHEPLELEYDLFYIKELAPSLDLVIFVRSLLAPWRPRRH